jgi:hypothetical protein
MQMPNEKNTESESWKTFAAIAALVAPLFAVLWLGVTLTTDCGSFTLAVIKIVFAILVVGTGITGIRWMTASGITLLVEALLVVLWVVLRIESYPPNGALRTITILAVPVTLSGVLFVLAGGMKAGTWPPARLRSSV